MLLMMSIMVSCSTSSEFQFDKDSVNVDSCSNFSSIDNHFDQIGTSFNFDSAGIRRDFNILEIETDNTKIMELVLINAPFRKKDCDSMWLFLNDALVFSDINTYYALRQHYSYIPFAFLDRYLSPTLILKHDDIFFVSKRQRMFFLKHGDKNLYLFFPPNDPDNSFLLFSERQNYLIRHSRVDYLRNNEDE